MSASPEFYKPAAPAAFSSPCASPRPAGLGLGGVVGVGGDDYYHHGSCRTPTGSGISYLKEPTTCPPAPRKPPAPLCKKRLFKGGETTAEVPLISVRLDELERIFRPRPSCDKRRRSARNQNQRERDPPTQTQHQQSLD